MAATMVTIIAKLIDMVTPTAGTVKASLLGIGTAAKSVTAATGASAASMLVGATALHRLGTAAVKTSALLGTAGLAGALSTAVFASRNQYELDKLQRHIAFIGELSEEGRISVRKLIEDTSYVTGLGQVELTKGMDDLIAAGMSVEELLTKTASGETIFERIAKTARGANEPVEAFSENLKALAAQASLPTTGAEGAATYERILGLLAIAPALSPDTTGGHALGLYHFLGNATLLGMSIEEASALQNTLSRLGYRNAAAGTALKTIFARLLKPTPAAIAEMEQAGFDYNAVMGGDRSRLLEADRLVSTFNETGRLPKMSKKLINGVMKVIKENQGKSVFAITAAIEDKIVKTGKWTAAQKQAIKKAAEIFVRESGIRDVDPEIFLRELAKLGPEGIAQLTGIHRAAQGAALTSASALEIYRETLAGLSARMTGAIDESFSKQEGWAMTVDRLSAAFQNLRNAIWDSGYGNQLESLASRVADFVQSLSEADPAKLNSLAASITAVAAAIGALMAAGITMKSLAMLAGLLSLFGVTAPAWLVPALGLAAAGAAGWWTYNQLSGGTPDEVTTTDPEAIAQRAKEADENAPLDGSAAGIVWDEIKKYFFGGEEAPPTPSVTTQTPAPGPIVQLPPVAATAPGVTLDYPKGHPAGLPPVATQPGVGSGASGVPMYDAAVSSQVQQQGPKKLHFNIPVTVNQSQNLTVNSATLSLDVTIDTPIEVIQGGPALNSSMGDGVN
jgi:hypothetical protein